MRNTYFTVDFGAVRKQNLNQTSVNICLLWSFLHLSAHFFCPPVRLPLEREPSVYYIIAGIPQTDTHVKHP